jgi:hypothetical protein
MVRAGFALWVLVILLNGCTPPSVTLVNPRNGDRRQCSTAELGTGADEFVESSRVRACVHQWRSLGYIETDKLTAEQRARLRPENSQQ